MVNLSGWQAYLWDQACDVLMLMDEHPQEETKNQTISSKFGAYG